MSDYWPRCCFPAPLFASQQCAYAVRLQCQSGSNSTLYGCLHVNLIFSRHHRQVTSICNPASLDPVERPVVRTLGRSQPSCLPSFLPSFLPAFPPSFPSPSLPLLLPPYLLLSCLPLSLPLSLTPYLRAFILPSHRAKKYISWRNRNKSLIYL
jgi:hypothetical protein